MEYQYNYSFLSEWIKANPNIQVKAILEAIGSKSNNSLRSWEQKQCAMPVIALLRFCNAFQVPISAFLYNTGEPCKTEVDISDTAQFEPEGGYTTDPSKRLPGERKPLAPTNVTIIQSIVPNSKVLTPSEEETKTIENGSTQVEPNRNALNVIDLQNRHMANEAEHFKQQQRMLDIIAKQQEQIRDLTKLLQEEREKSKPSGYETIAEP